MLGSEYDGQYSRYGIDGDTMRDFMRLSTLTKLLSFDTVSIVYGVSDSDYGDEYQSWITAQCPLCEAYGPCDCVVKG